MKFATVRDAVASSEYSHSRRGSGCWRDVVWIYVRDPESPTGVRIADIEVSYTAQEAENIISDSRKCFPLSPTEPR